MMTPKNLYCFGCDRFRRHMPLPLDAPYMYQCEVCELGRMERHPKPQEVEVPNPPPQMWRPA